MGFEGGSISCRMFYVPREFPKNAIELFAKHAAAPIDSLSDGEINGWVGWRHLLDRKIGEDNAMYAGFLRLTLMKAERKIPESLLRAECKMEEYAQMQAAGTDRLSQATRSEIRREVSARLQPQMPPTLKGIPFVYDHVNKLLFAGALSEKQVEAFQAVFTQTLGFSLIPVLPETASLKRLETSIKEWDPTSFSPDAQDDEVGLYPGRDFLTWLWFVAEARGGMMKLKNVGDFAVLIEGPLLFVMEGGGAHETALRKGEPLLSAEAKTALLSGKKLRRAKLTLARADESWSCTFDADEFILRGLKLPEGEKLDALSRFQDRMRSLDLFKEALLGFFDRFVEERGNAKEWAKTVEDIRAWVKGRKTRR